MAPRVWISSIAGGTPVPLTNGEGYEDAPSWSPDGDWIALLAFTPRGELALVKARVGAGGAPIVLRSGIPPFLSRPQWSPDGRWIVCEMKDGLALVAADGSSSRIVSDIGWIAYSWGGDGRRIYGLRPTDDQHHFKLVSLDLQTGVERVINGNLGTVPQALQPIRGFSPLRGRGFLTSIARVRSDIHLVERFRLKPTLWERLISFRGAAR